MTVPFAAWAVPSARRAAGGGRRRGFAADVPVSGTTPGSPGAGLTVASSLPW